MIWLGAYFKAYTLGHISRMRAGLCLPFWLCLGVPKWPQKGEKQYKKPAFWLFWTIPPNRMGLMFYLGAFLMLKH
jgi:hypothetical protein